MTEDRPRDAQNVARRNGETPREESVRLGAEYQRPPRTRSRAPSDILLHHLTRVRFRRPSRARELRRESQSRFGCGNVADHSLQRARRITADHWHQRLRLGARGRAQNSYFRVLVGISYADVEQKSIELRFGERIGPFLLDRILRRQYKEWIGQRHRYASRTDSVLLHRLEQ